MTAVLHPWRVAVVAALAVAGGLQLGSALGQDFVLAGIPAAALGLAQLTLAVLVATRPSPLVRVAALATLVAPPLAWIRTGDRLGEDVAVLSFGLGVALLHLVAATVLWALPTHRATTLGRRPVLALPALALLGALTLVVGPSYPATDDSRDPASASPPTASMPRTDQASIFGDLFAGHDAGHDARHDTGHDAGHDH